MTEQEPVRFPGRMIVEQYLHTSSLEQVDTGTLVDALPEIKNMLIEYQDDPENYERIEMVIEAVEMELVRRQLK